jgi:hypothetical protein
MNGPTAQHPPTEPPRGPARSRLRRRLAIAGGAVAGIATIMLAADAAFGAVAHNRAGCQAAGGVAVDTDLAALPVTSGLVTGSIGTAAAAVPWQVIEDAVSEGLPPGSPLSLTGDDGLVVAQTSRFDLPVVATLRPELNQSGTIEFTLEGLTVAGRDVPPELAQSFSGTDSLLPGLSGEDGFDVPYAITAIDVGADGLSLSLRIPLSALTSPGDRPECLAATP